MSKYKYYFKKPRGEIVKDILRWSATVGVIAIAAHSPYFVSHILKEFSRKNKKKYKQRSVESAFYRLHKKGLIQTQKHRHQIFISLTDEGKKKAGWLQVNDLQIATPKKWDGKWRVLIFDIPDANRFARDALRGILSQCEFYPIQKSVWAHAHDCKDEVEFLRTFFGFTSKELRLMKVAEIEDEEELIKKFRIR